MDQPTHRDDDYLPCSEYQGVNPDENGIHKFEEGGKFYFSLIDHGIVVLRSEGYSSEAGRENGIASVLKNASIEEQYVTKMLPDGRWVLSLKAGNHQEIARSCPEDSEEEAKSYLPSERAKFAAEFLRLASIEAGTVPQENVAFGFSKDNEESDKEADDYMICREYEEKLSSTSADHEDFIVFQHENTGKYYFAWVDGDKVVMRSEGYPTSGARDNGLQSVLKNRELEERYKIEEHHGAFFLVLKAGNHQEIGRSCPMATEAEAKAYLPSERAKAIEAAKLALVPDVDISDKEADDYMICREYEEKVDTASVDADGFIRFQHEHTGKYYFAWVSGSGEIIMRSEGYPTTGARDNGMESVKKNREIRERFKVEEHHGAYFLVLKAGNHQEIGRSCPKDSEAALWAMLEPKTEVPVEAVALAAVMPEVEAPIIEVPEVVVPEVVVPEVVVPEVEIPAVAIAAPVIAAAAAASSIEYKEKEKEDDYLACGEYKGYSVSDKANNIAFFKHKNGQFYFVVYKKDGSVRLRSEGFKTAQERDQELRGVIKYLNDDKMYSTIEKAGYTMMVLKDKTGREVGRSCPEKPGAVIPPAAVVAPVVVAAAAAAASSFAEEKPKPVAAPQPVVLDKPGFNWWWLLPLLLLIPLFFWFKSCGDKSAQLSEVAPVQDTIKQEAVAVDTVTKTEAPVAAAPSCDLNWILFDFDKFNIKADANTELEGMAKILKDNPTYKGVLRAYTDARGSNDYNQRLSENRSNAAKAVLVGLGIEEARLSATASSEADPIAKNTDDDSGRRFNRRVELYIQDANGKDVCKSIAPEVPQDLKGN